MLSHYKFLKSLFGAFPFYSRRFSRKHGSLLPRRIRSYVWYIHSFEPIHFHRSLFTVNSLYCGQCSDLKLMSSLARVRSSESLSQSNVCTLFLRGDLATLRIVGVSVIAVCLQGASWPYSVTCKEWFYFCRCCWCRDKRIKLTKFIRTWNSQNIFRVKRGLLHVFCRG